VTTKRRLRTLIGSLAAQGLAQLPPEEELSGLLGVSRATLRSALLSLQKEGLISRQQGRGTFIHGAAVALQANLGEDRAFLDVLGECGYRAGARARVTGVDAADAASAQRLRVAVGSPVLGVERLFLADDRPAVLARDLIPLACLTVPWELARPEDSIFAFCAAWCGQPVSYSVAEIVPVAADAATAESLACAPGTPLLCLFHRHLGAADKPLAVTRAYLDDRYLRFSVVRTGVEA